MTRDFKELIPLFIVLAIFTLLMGCGRGAVTIANKAITETQRSARMAMEGVDEFKFCVARIRLESTEDKSADSEDESNYTQFTPGLIDMTSGEAQDWDKLELPSKAKVARIKIKVKKDESLCGVPFSLLFNGLSTPRDIEFRWTFDPPIDVDGTTKALRLSFQEIVDSLRDSAMSDEIQLKERIEQLEPEAEKE